VTLWYFAAWKVRVRSVRAMRKSSTKNWRPTSMGMTAGGRSRYGRGIGSREYVRRGGHGDGRRMPL
jgi:hypothetical protein